MIVAHWNNPIVSSELRGIVRVGLRGDWPNCTPYFTVDGREVPARDAAARLKLVPVIDWIFNAGIPAGFDSANVMALCDAVEAVYKALGGWRGLSKAKRNGIFHLTDAENWTGYPAQTFAGQLCDWFAWCLREVGFGGDYGNYATVPAGKPTLYPCAQTAARTTVPVLVAYMVSEPGKCYPAVDVARCLERATNTVRSPGVVMRWNPPTVWIVLSEYNDPESFADAVDCGANILIWTDEAKRNADPEWARQQDKAIINTLRGAGWTGVN